MTAIKPLVKKEIQYLRDSKSIKDKLKALFETAERKVAIVGFVGGNATEYIPNFENLEIYCWPLPHATNPDGIIALTEMGANVYFKEKLHAKIYWAEGRGIIIGSANLSDNALGENGLQEFAVYIRDKNFNIDDVIKKFKLDGLSKFSKRQLNELRRKSRLSVVPSQGFGCKRKKRSFEAYMNDEYREPIKLLYYHHNYSKEDREQIEQQVVVPLKNYNDAGRSIKEGNLCLQVHLDDDEHLKNKKQPITWFVVDELIDYEGQQIAIQKEKIKNVPFKVYDSTFVDAFKHVFNLRDLDQIRNRNTSIIKDDFLKSVLRRMKKK